MKDKTTAETVMIVGDTPVNLRYLQEILHQRGYRVLSFLQGVSALRAAVKNPPDIILLDIMMPDMNGFEVCKRLKADPSLRRIPVLFIGALIDREDKTQAFAAGGVDYVTKPYDEQEVLTRIDTHLKLYRLNRELEEMVELRTAELVAANETLKQEISVRKRVEEQLRSHQALLQSVFEGIAEPLILLDGAMRIKLYNNSAAAYYQAAGTGIVRNEAFDAIERHMDGELCDILCKLAKGVACEPIVYLERKAIADPERIEQVSLYPIEGDEGMVGRAIIRIVDITEERRQSQEMAQADKLIALGTLVAGVAHEINNPTHVILLNTPAISEVWQRIQPILDEHLASNGDFPVGNLLYSELKQEVPALLSDIESSANRIKRIVSVLKEYSEKNNNLVLAPVDINTVVEDALLLMGHRIKKSTNRFHVTYGQGIPSLTADGQKLEQVVVNLIANALESLPDKNRAVWVETSYDSEKQEVTIEVRDEGIGIPPAFISRIMDPFFTTKKATGGTGLGMAIVEQIVKLHHGRIEVASEEGGGSTFKVTLPLSRSRGKAIFLPAERGGNRGVL